MNDLFALARAFHVVATASLMGTLVFRLLAAPAFSASAAAALRGLDRRLHGLALASLASAAASAPVWLLFVAASAADMPLAETVTSGDAWRLLTATTFGHVWLARFALMAVLALVLCVPARIVDEAGVGRGHANWQDRLPPPLREGGGHTLLAVVLATALMGSLGFAGHAAASEGAAGVLHIAADVVHLIAAGAWLGGLIPLALLLNDAARLDAAHAVTDRFSLVGMISVAALVLTGIVNTIMLAGSVPALIGTDYGHLLGLKLALFVGMLGLAAVNRYRLTPALAHNAEASRRETAQSLRRNALVETGLGILMLVIVGWLGILQPGLHQEPWWPLGFRVADSLDLSFPPDEGVLALTMIAAGLGVVANSLGGSRVLVAAGLLIALVSLPGLRGLTVAAYPTSFRQSPTGYTAASIARGRDLFATHCVGCHGAQGRGNGVLARDLQVAPADLTADHVYDHRDGDLFWWITTGLGAMPGFAALDEAARWSLIDFIHANADGARLRREPGAVTAAAFPAPAVTIDCADGSRALADLAGRVVRLVGAASPAAARTPLPGVTTVVVGEGGEAGCVAREDLAAVLAIYGDADAAARSEILIDTQGRVRALWLPGTTTDWSDPAILARLMDDMARIRAGPGRASSSAHRH